MPGRSEPRPPPDVEVDDDREGQKLSGASKWQVDRHVPLALLAGIGAQTVVAIWWAATFSAAITERVTVLERQATASAPISERLVKLETKFDAAVDTLTEIKNLIRQVPTRQAP